MSLLLHFEHAGRAYFARASEVVQVMRTVGDDAIRPALFGPGPGGRGLRVRVDESLHTLAVERIRGMVDVASERVHPLPPILQDCLSSPALSGLVETEEGLCPLVELAALVREWKHLEETAHDE